MLKSIAQIIVDFIVKKNQRVKETNVNKGVKKGSYFQSLIFSDRKIFTIIYICDQGCIQCEALSLSYFFAFCLVVAESQIPPVGAS